MLMFDNAAIILFLIGLAAETMNLTDLAAEIMSHLLCLYITSIYKVVVGKIRLGTRIKVRVPRALRGQHNGR